MPATQRLGLLVRRCFGGLLLIPWIFVALSLITWSVNDPSLTHAASGAVRNWMGPLGAIVSDLLVQTLGLCSIVAILPPAYWAVQIATQGRVARFKTRLACLPIAVVGLATALSSLPIMASWAIRYGFGGMIGDLLHGRVVGLLSIINSSRAGIAAGIFGFAIGLAALQRSFGLSNAELRELLLSLVNWTATRKAASMAPAANISVANAVPQEPAFAAAATLPIPSGQHPNMFALHPAVPYGQPHAAPIIAPVAPHPQSIMQPHPIMGQPMPNPSWAQSAPRANFSAPMQQSPMVLPGMMPVAFTPPPSVAPLAFTAPPQPAPQMAPVVAPAPAPAPMHVTSIEPDPESQRIARRFVRMVMHARPAMAPPAPAQVPVPAPVQELAPAIPAPVFIAELAREPVPAPEPIREPTIIMPEAAPAPRAITIAPGGFFDRLANGVRRQEASTQHYRRPSLNLLKRFGASPSADRLDQAKLQERSRLLLETLSDFGIKGEIVAVRPGPVVTLFEFEPARGTKSSRVIALADDIARSMSARAVRIAVVPGVNAIGIEMPNVTREGVSLRDLLESEAFRNNQAKLPMALGKSIGGEAVVADLARMPHLLVAGTTGSGKSVGVNAMILSLLFQLSPEECRLILIDPKMLELSVYKDIPHLLTPVVTDPNKALAALNWAVGEMESRYKRMSALSVRNIEVFNNRVRNGKKLDDMRGGTGGLAENEFSPMPHIVIVVDEFADLMAVAGKEIEFAVQRLAQMARAAGIHLIMATQRPSVDVVTGTIKANFPSRMSFRVTSRIDSRTILNEQGAEQLLGQGDMLYATGAGQVMRVHGPFVSDEEVESIANHLRSLGSPSYVDGVTDTPDVETQPAKPEPIDEDDLYDRAVTLVRNDRKASISYLQRRLGIGYNRAADLIERMQTDGLVSPPNASGKRELMPELSQERDDTPPPDNDDVITFTRRT